MGWSALQAIISDKAVTEPRSADFTVKVRGYRPELDVVRFLAFLLVYFSHIIPRYYYPDSPIAWLDPGTASIVFAMANACSMGLCLFFTLSAYLITGLLLEERERNAVISVRKFYLRRLLRIWPLYFFGIALGIALAYVLHQSLRSNGFLWYLLFAGNFFCAAHGWSGNPMNPLWSISIEEQFYLVWPWAMRWFSRRGLFLCAFFFILAANGALYVLGERHANTDTTIWANTLVQFEMFATGILLALADKYQWLIAPKFGFLLLFAGPLLWFTACYAFQVKQPAVSHLAVNGLYMMIGYVLISLGCAAVLKGCCILGPYHMPKRVAYLGKISYGLYVYHVLAIWFTVACCYALHGLNLLFVSSGIALLLTIVAAILSYTYLETPFLRLKRRFEIVHSRPI
jgi:peptidoglycan/LPS O-acetylase OafA/YrhL